MCIRDSFEEWTDPNFVINIWQQFGQHRSLLHLAQRKDEEGNLKLRELLSIVDAKSLYDHLSTETSGMASDRRTAIEVQIVRNSLDIQHGSVRWVDHPGMYADALTKLNGNIPLVHAMMEHGIIAITHESQTLLKHLHEGKRGSKAKLITTK